MGSYQIRDHARMFGERRRNHAYAAALRAAIAPGDTVLDIGTGTGLLAMLACQAGASRVYAVESAPIITLARELAARNSMLDRITFIEQSSLTLTLPEEVDVIVSDVRGVLPLAGHSFRSILDARDRFLGAGGRMIPAVDLVFGALVRAPELYRRLVEVWGDSEYGIDGSPVRSAATQQVIPVAAVDLELASPAVQWAAIDYRRASAPSVSGSMRWTVTEGPVHGFAMWFEAQLAAGISYETGPGSGDQLYGAAFFPWPDPLTITEPTCVEVTVRADYVGGSYVWSWRTAVTTGKGHRSYEQSTFAGAPLSPARLRASHEGHRPAVSVAAAVDAIALSLVCRGATLGEIGARLRASFPARFPGETEAVAYAADLASRYERRSF